MGKLLETWAGVDSMVQEDSPEQGEGNLLQIMGPREEPTDGKHGPGRDLGRFRGLGEKALADHGREAGQGLGVTTQEGVPALTTGAIIAGRNTYAAPPGNVLCCISQIPKGARLCNAA